MYDNYNYPPGADTPQAPWNQEETPEKDFNVTVYQSLKKNTTVTTNNYIEERCIEPENGFYEVIENTENINWSDEYSDNEHYTPLQLINLFKRYLESELGDTVRISKFPSYLKHLVKECDNWVEEDFYIEEA